MKFPMPKESKSPAPKLPRLPRTEKLPRRRPGKTVTKATDKAERDWKKIIKGL